MGDPNGEKDAEFHETLSSVPHHILEGKTGSSGGKIALEFMIYAGAAIIALLAISAFYYFFVHQSLSGSVVEINQAVEDQKNTVKIQYSIELEDGTAVVNGTESFDKGYVGEALGISDKIDELIENMSVKDEASYFLKADEAFGQYDEKNIVAINRTEKVERRAEIDKVVTMDLSQFEQDFGAKPELNKTYSIEGLPWNYSIVSLDAAQVTVSQDAKVGQIAPISDIFFMVISEVAADKLVTMLTVENQTVSSENGNLTILNGAEFVSMTLTPTVGNMISLGDLGPAKVLRFDEEKIYLDYNSPYAGKDVNFKVKILEKVD